MISALATFWMAGNILAAGDTITIHCLLLQSDDVCPRVKCLREVEMITVACVYRQCLGPHAC
jgi:hypothetical protein